MLCMAETLSRGSDVPSGAVDAAAQPDASGQSVAAREELVELRRQVFVPGETTGCDQPKSLPDQREIEARIDLQQPECVVPVARPAFSRSQKLHREQVLRDRDWHRTGTLELNGRRGGHDLGLDPAACGEQIDSKAH